MGAICLEHYALFDFVIDGVERSGGMRLQADGIDAFLRSFTLGKFVQGLNHAFFIKVDRRSPASLGHGEPFGHVIDSDDLFGTEQNCTADGHLTNRAAPPDSYRVSRLDVALHGGLPARRKDVT